MWSSLSDATDAVAFLPRSSGAESKADPGGPRAALEEEYGEDDTEAHAEAGSNEHR
jgi:hypothetical protein